MKKDNLTGDYLAINPINTLDEIPVPNKTASEIIGLVKNNGKITGYVLSNNKIVTKEEGLKLAKNGEIKGIGIAHRNETEYLKSIPDGIDKNNLSNLPTITEAEIRNKHM